MKFSEDECELRTLKSLNEIFEKYKGKEPEQHQGVNGRYLLPIEPENCVTDLLHAVINIGK